MGTEPIGWGALTLAFVPLLISIAFFRVLGVKFTGELVTSVVRMAVQLFLVGLYLTFLFRLDHPAVSVGYVLLMAAVANYTILKGSGLRLTLYVTTLPALATAIFLMLGWYMVLVFRPEPIYSARYLIPVAGMLLGNSMRRTIVTLERFYTSVRDDEDGFTALVVFGANRWEAAIPYLRRAYSAGLAPAIADMATIGLVFLPGMMTGQILGGVDPFVAVQYQMVIVLGIFATTELATIFCVLISLRRGFGEFGFLRREILK